jgi:hypothetical protein
LIVASSANKDAALALASRGFRIFPCNPDKTPRVAAWEQAATNSQFAVAVRWEAAPECLPALPVGVHSLVVIDADRKAGGADGVAAFHALCAEQRIDLSTAFIVETPTGGYHFYFTAQTPYGNSRGSLPDGIDVRGLGGYVIAPGATLPDGRTYRHVCGFWDAIPQLPEPLARFLREKRPVASPAPASAVDASLIGERERLCAAAALADEVAKLRAMGEGSGRNRALNEASHSLGTMDGWIDLNEVADALWQASIVNGYVAKDGEAAAKQTIISGLAAGRTKPRPLLSYGSISDEYIRQTQQNLIGQYKARQPSQPVKEWPAAMNADAYIGIAGDFIRLVAPHTEGDPCALLIAFLTVVGSIMGRSAYLPVGPTSHYPNLFSVIVAETSKGRKGTVMAEARRFAKMIDATIANRMLGGLSSGEGLIEAVRDARLDDSPIDSAKIPIAKVIDNGIADKRLLVTESEMGQALQAAARDGNTLSATLRMAWDGDELRTLARSNKNVCRQPHISIFGNITLDELQRLLTTTDRNNGFANRFLWVCARRSQLLPWGGNVDSVALDELAAKASHVISLSMHYGKCGWVPDAASMWAKEYGRLSSGKTGLAGAMSARAEAQTLRIALIYAVMDGCNNVDVYHLRAALEVWRYCQDSVDYCFGSASGDTTADRILNMLASTPEGASLTQISAHFGRNKSKDELQRALDTLKTTGKARLELRKTGGRAAVIWFAC